MIPIRKESELPHKITITIIGTVRDILYCGKSLIDEDNEFWDSYYEAFGFDTINEIRVGDSLENIIRKKGKYVKSKNYFHELFSDNHSLPVEVKTTYDDFGYEVKYDIEIIGEFDPSKLQLVKSTELPTSVLPCFIIGEYILYDGKRYNMTAESNEELDEAIVFDDLDEFDVYELCN